MTNNDYIIKTLGLFGIGQDTVDVILIDGGISGDAYLDTTMCKKAIYKDFYFVRAAAHRNVSEGGFSLSWNDCEKALKDLEQSLADEVGDDTEDAGGFGCIDRSYMW